MTDLLTRQALATAAALLDAAARDDGPAMRKILTRINAAPPTTDDIAAIVREAAIRFGASVEMILGQSRHREAIEARHVVCYVGHVMGLSYSHIGRQIGRDHSSVMNACSRVGENARLHRVALSIAEMCGYERAAA